MRNIRILHRGEIVPDARTYPDLDVITAAFDVFTDSLVVVLGAPDADIIEVQQFLKDGSVRILASFPAKAGDKIRSFAHFADILQCVFVFEHGDIITCDYSNNMTGDDPDSTLVEIVGSIDAGIQCAAWSPDEETLALLTGDKSVVLLSRTFDPIAETVQSSNDLDMTTQVNVGWGKKETQFKGRGVRGIERAQRETLKHAGLNLDSDHAILHDPTLKEAEDGALSKYDDGSATKLSWRGDCQYFAVISVDESVQTRTKRRVIRVYSRDGVLQSCSEPTDGQEENLAWKPQGALMACTQRRSELDEETDEQYEELYVVFFERNGLRHGEFSTRLAPGTKVVDIDWSSNNEVLLLQLDNRVQVWYTKNYHWYLKQEMYTANRDKLMFAKFHPEKPLRVMLGSSTGVTIVDMTYCITSGPMHAPHDQGMTVVIDGTTCMVTPLAKAHVPPPACYREVEVGEPIMSVAVSQSNETFAIITNTHLYIAKLPLGGKVVPQITIVATLDKAQFCDFETDQLRQVAIRGNAEVYVLYDSQESGSMLARLDLSDDHAPVLSNSIEVAGNLLSLKTDVLFSKVAYELVGGMVYVINEDGSPEKVGQFSQLCVDYSVVETPSGAMVCIGLTENGKLLVGSRQLRTGATSMLVTDSFLLYTTAQHELKFMHLSNPALVDETLELKEPVTQTRDDGQPIYDERTRLIERGSWLISSVPSKATVTLQAPRGNIETIYPRIMVLSGVRKDIKAKKYHDAFLTCRTHRIQLDILHDYDPALFESNVELFINELGSVEYLDLFVSCLLDEDVAETKYKETGVDDDDELANGVKNLTLGTPKSTTTESGKVAKICDSILQVLLRPEYKKKYLQSIITAYACQTPPKTAEALEMIGTLENDSETEKAVQHLCFLQDVIEVYKIALSIYNIPLALVVAQQSQMDPKEYLPFLQKLHSAEENRRKFLVDTYLKNYEKALDSLATVTDSNDSELEEEIRKYIIEHDLYKHALQMYRYDEERFRKVLKLYADHLHGQQKYTDSALAYEKLGMEAEALNDYVEARKWREAMSIALKPEFQDQVTETAEQLVMLLNVAHDHASAAYLEYKYLDDLEESLRLYCKAFDFSKAMLLTQEEQKPELVESIIDPALGEGFGTIAELLAECDSQTQAQLKRLRELREKKEADPFAFYGGDAEAAEAADNVSIAPSESTLQSSVFTRYTGQSNSTAKTGATRRTQKNRRREERKRARGKKGTIYEEEYLIRSTGRLIDRLHDTIPDAEQLVETLVRRDMIEQAHQIQDKFTTLLTFLKDHAKEIYTMNEKDRERLDSRGMVYLIPEIPVPEIKEFPSRAIVDF